MFGLTWDQVKGPIQGILGFVGGFVVSRGYLTAEAMTGIIGGILTIIGAIWIAKSSTKTAIADAAAALPNVERVVPTNDLAGRELAQNTAGSNVVLDPPKPSQFGVGG